MHCGNKVTNVLRYWYDHFVHHGEILPDAALYRKHPNSMRQSKWMMDTTAQLIEIVLNDPNLCLDKIRERLAYFGGIWWSAASISFIKS
jgi:hypothetical protein